jgi:hypothetical protein
MDDSTVCLSGHESQQQIKAKEETANWINPKEEMG